VKRICPSCEKPQPYFVYRRSKRGWVTCPRCGKYIRKRDIPSRFGKVIAEDGGSSERQIAEAVPQDEGEGGGVLAQAQARPRRSEPDPRLGSIRLRMVEVFEWARYCASMALASPIENCLENCLENSIKQGNKEAAHHGNW